MKRIPVLLMLAAAFLLFVHDDLVARGPGGGGARGGGAARAGAGAARPAAPATGAGRSPAVSPGTRPATGNVGVSRPNVGTGAVTRPATGNVGVTRPNVGAGAATRPAVGAVTRPSAGQLNNFLDVPRASTGAIGTADNIGRGGAAADFLNGGARPSTLPAGVNRPAQLPAGPIAGRPGVGTGVGDAANRRQNFADNRPSRVDNRQQLQSDRQDRRDEIRDQVRENNPRLAFWADHPNWAAWRINRPYRWATWAALTGWFGWGGGSSETTYAYGDNIYYSGDQVYYGDQPVATAEQYAEQAAAIAASAPQDLNPQTSDWMPLGVFAVTEDREATGAAPTLFMQLAVNKDGVISGTFKNDTTGDVQTVEGMIDKKSQRVAWCVQGKSWPIVETGLSNLTQDTAPVLVHFEDGETQQWLLVRLPEPKEN
jgi:hypothetical protein